jgi:lipoyl-dependent peroxiredoxin
MSVRSANAIWEGTLKEGSGNFKTGSGVLAAPYNFRTRFEEEPGTNPEELIAAAHAGCYSMFLSAQLTNAGFIPTSITTTAKVHLEAGPTITLIELNTEAVVPGVDEAKFAELAQVSKEKCPISKALASVEIKLDAKLIK